MRRHIRWLTLTVVFSVVWAATAFGQVEGSGEGEVLRNAQMVKQLMAGRSNRLGASAGPDPDTVYVGKSFESHRSG